MNRNMTAAACAAIFSLALVACGGGGGGSASPGGSVATPLTLSGTAATGLAIASRTIEARCASGTGSATTSASGGFTITVSGGSLPCVLQVTALDGTLLRSVAQGSGSAATVNVTPLSEMLVARMAGGDPATFFSSFDASKVTPERVEAALVAVRAAVAPLVDLAGVNPLTDALLAATTGNPTGGNALDQKLDALKAGLAAAGTTLPQIVNAVVANLDAPASGGAAAVAELLKPAAARCASMRSGRHRWINVNEASGSVDRTYVLRINALTGVITYGDNSTDTATADGDCTFSLRSGTSRVFASPSGVWVNRFTDALGLKRIGLGFPEQSLTLADLAGSWNGIGFFRSALVTNPLEMSHSRVTLDASGTLSVAECGNGLTACGAFQVKGQLSVNSAGGFNFVAAAGAQGPDRLFAFRAPSGAMMFAALFPQEQNAIFIATKEATLTLPAVNDVQKFWDMSVNAAGVAGVYSDELRNVTAVDTAAQSYTNVRPSDGRVNVFEVNQPRRGLRHRPGATVTLNSGATIAVNEIVVLPMTGIGISVYGRVTPTVTNGFYGYSVTKPATSTAATPGAGS